MDNVITMPDSNISFHQLILFLFPPLYFCVIDDGKVEFQRNPLATFTAVSNTDELPDDDGIQLRKGMTNSSGPAYGDSDVVW